MGYGHNCPANQPGGQIFLWVIVEYGLSGIWVTRESTVISYRNAYQSLITNLKNKSTVTPDANLVELNQEEHPLITFWDKHDFSEGCNDEQHVLTSGEVTGLS
jgi:hypothetical protein